MKASNYKWLLDAGHGGLKNGRYVTAPAKMHRFEDGLVIYEGVNNRAIVTRLMALLERNGIDFATMYDPCDDTPLAERVALANRYDAAERRENGRSCIYLSIHSDAMPEGAHGKGSGSSIFTSKGQTRSDKVADIFCEVYQEEMKGFRFRKDESDGDADQEENFYVLRYTNCAALLVENLFFDNRREAEFLMSEVGQQRIAETLFKCIVATEMQLGPDSPHLRPLSPHPQPLSPHPQPLSETERGESLGCVKSIVLQKEKSL
jgi:N-acetylmuramoyl-L-alanine amidase